MACFEVFKEVKLQYKSFLYSFSFFEQTSIPSKPIQCFWSNPPSSASPSLLAHRDAKFEFQSRTKIFSKYKLIILEVLLNQTFKFSFLEERKTLFKAKL